MIRAKERDWEIEEIEGNGDIRRSEDVGIVASMSKAVLCFSCFDLPAVTQTVTPGRPT